MLFLILALGGAFRSSASAQAMPSTLAPDAAWCWFGNPRAVFKDGLLYFGYVRFADGRACLDTFNPQTGVSTPLWASAMTERDDHNNPALLELSDGWMLAIFQKHGTETRFYWRSTTNANAASASSWAPESAFDTGANATYANPYQLTAESGRIYSFLRDLNWNPTFVTSDPNVTNWSAPTILVKTGTGSTRPYAQYCSDGVRRIDSIYTDGHPDSIPCSLYHLYYQDGALRQTDGTFLKYLTNAPLLHDSAERGSVIYQYSAAATNDPNAWIPSGRAWCWDLAYHTNGAPVAAFSVRSSSVTGTNWYDDRIYYYYARWTGSHWQKRFIAQAGRPLYKGQQSYAGGLTIDPRNPDVVYLSSNAANPFDLTTLTNVPLRANSRYEIYRGTTSDGGLTFTWQSVTTNSAIDNLRPYVPRKNPYPVGLIWYAGSYVSYTSWNTTAFGWFGTNLVPFIMTSNAAPVINGLKPAATPLLFTNLSNKLRLQAAVTDDGQPGPLSVLWSTVSGPTNAFFADAASTDTGAGFPLPGNYTLRLTAGDTSRSTAADLTVLAGVHAPTESDPALALWLKLDEAAGGTAADSSSGGNPGSVAPGASWAPTGGARGGAIQLNGTSGFINVPDAVNLDGTSAFTLAYWFKANSYTTGGAGLVSKRNSVSDNNAYTTFLQVDRLIYVDIAGSDNRFASVTAFDTGAWYHVAITFDGAQATNQRVRLYVNGMLDRVAAESSPTIPNYNSSLKIGLTHSNVTTFLSGAMDDIRVYRRALSDTEVASVAALRQAPSVSPGLAPQATNGVLAGLSGSANSDGQGGPLAVRWEQITGPATARFSASTQTVTSVTFGAAGNYVLRLAAADNASEVFADLPVTVAPNSNVFADWIVLAYPGQTNPAIIGPAADPERDGTPNLIEFALGLNPTVSDAAPFKPGQPGLPIGQLMTISGTNYLAMTVQRPTGRLGIEYGAETTADLRVWSDAIQAGPPVASGNGTEQVVFRDRVAVDSAPFRFIRLKITPI